VSDEPREPPPDNSWLEMEPIHPPGPIRRALHRHWEARRYAREMRAKHAEVLAAMAEVGIIRETVEQRLQRALAAVAERDAWIYDDEWRARLWETWRAARAHGAADETEEGR
jgi:nitrate reductase beta subunit